jgi:YhcH/YjgK/YiaL family protein
MIWNKLCDSERLRQLHPGFAAALDFLHRQDLAELSVGTYEIDEKRVYAMVQEGKGHGHDAARLETHHRYIDIQYTISGNEVIGCGQASRCTPDADGWNNEKDICFFIEKPEFLLPVPAGSFAIFFPHEDAHAPMAGIDQIRKVVVKIEMK